MMSFRFVMQAVIVAAVLNAAVVAAEPIRQESSEAATSGKLQVDKRQFTGRRSVSKNAAITRIESDTGSFAQMEFSERGLVVTQKDEKGKQAVLELVDRGKGRIGGVLRVGRKSVAAEAPNAVEVVATLLKKASATIGESNLPRSEAFTALFKNTSANPNAVSELVGNMKGAVSKPVWDPGKDCDNFCSDCARNPSLWSCMMCFACKTKPPHLPDSNLR